MLPVIKNRVLRQAYLANTDTGLEPKIRQVKNAQSLSAVLQLAAARSAKVRREVAKKLGGWVHETKAQEALLRMVQRDDDAQTRWFAALSLSETDPQEHLPVIRKLLSQHKPPKWILASILLKDQVPAELKDILIRRLESDKPEIKNLALVLLARMGELEIVKQFTNDPHPAVRESSLALLGQESFPKIELARPETDKTVACLMGEGIGDALAVPVEFVSLETIRAVSPVKEYLQAPDRLDLKPGSFTDDTEMAVVIGNSIATLGQVNPCAIARDFGSFVLGLDQGTIKNRGYSASTLTSFRSIAAGLHWRLAGKDSNGCGPATAVVPLGLVIEDLDQLATATTAITNITKTGREALAGALAVSFLINQACYGQLPESSAQILSRTAQFVEPVSQSMACEIRRLESLLKIPTEEGLNQIPHNADGRAVRIGMKAMGVVPSAIYCFVKHLESFEETVLAAVHTAGDSDSIAAIAGAISGTHLGLSAIPRNWLEGLADRETLNQLGTQLAEVNPCKSQASRNDNNIV